jgi:hypothetical protein
MAVFFYESMGLIDGESREVKLERDADKSGVAEVVGGSELRASTLLRVRAIIA